MDHTASTLISLPENAGTEEMVPTIPEDSHGLQTPPLENYWAHKKKDSINTFKITDPLLSIVM